MVINRVLRSLLGEYIFMDYTSSIAYKRHLSQYYNSNNKEILGPECIYFMADGKIIHGGIGDRIYGIVALYNFCKLEGKKFNIFFVSPFNLHDYLEPNLYDWEDNLDYICYNSKVSKALIVKNTRKDNSYYLGKKVCACSAIRQLHVYTNSHVIDKSFSKLFNELFKPSQVLKSEIEKNLEGISGKYISITFRFQQLLGDFKEGNYQTLARKEKEILIEKCLNAIQNVKNENQNVSSVLVTSDSTYFLEKVKSKFSYVYVIPGKVSHVDYTDVPEKLAYLKSFVDLFMISKAEKIYCYSTGAMYKRSGFARLASLITDRPYYKIEE